MLRKEENGDHIVMAYQYQDVKALKRMKLVLDDFGIVPEGWPEGPTDEATLERAEASTEYQRIAGLFLEFAKAAFGLKE